MNKNAGRDVSFSLVCYSSLLPSPLIGDNICVRMNPSQAARIATYIRLVDENEQRIEQLPSETDCTKVFYLRERIKRRLAYYSLVRYFALLYCVNLTQSYCAVRGLV